MSRLWFPISTVLTLLAALIVGGTIGRARKPALTMAAAPAVKNGAVLFQVYCASCHGAEGHGDGMSAATLRPPPRDFAARPWRFEPTPPSIRRVTVDGIPGTAMPSFGSGLSEPEINAVVKYVHELATAAPVAERILSDEERLLHDAGFTDLRGTDPPPLTLCDAAGRKQRLSDFKGRLLLVHFWGTGCAHCIKEIPVLSALKSRFVGRLEVLHVCADEDDPAVAQEALDRLVPGTKGYTEANGLGLARFEVQLLPTVWLIDPAGQALGRATGQQDWRASAPMKLLERYLPMDAVRRPTSAVSGDY